MPPKLPLGLSDFQKLREKNCYYIDKSLLVQEIIESPAEVLLLSRPRCFGKTLNMSMLRYFFERSLEAGSNHAHLFDGLAISQTKYMEFQGRYPVIFLNFKDIKEGAFEGFLTQIRSVLASEFARHAPYLREKLTEEERNKYDLILHEKANRVEMELSLKFLVKCLRKVSGEKIVLLIDEYDTPILNAYNYDYYDDAVFFMRNLLGAALKDNGDIEKSVLTGVLRVAREYLFSGLNNMSVATLLSWKFSDKFGFTEAETEQLLKDHNCFDRLAEVCDWYGGYRFGQMSIFNPWSLLRFVDDEQRRCLPYWVNMNPSNLVRDRIIQGSPGVQAGIAALLMGDSVTSEIEEFATLRGITKSRIAVWSLLLHSGYLKATEHYRNDDRDFYRLVAPNREVRQFFRMTIVNWLNNAMGDERLDRMMEALLSGATDVFGQLFQELVTSVLSDHDMPQDLERAYQALMLTLLVFLGNRYRIVLNRDSSFGCLDAALIPDDSQDAGIVFEFKQYRSTKNTSVNLTLGGVFQQMRAKDYASELRSGGAERIFGLGIVFEGRRVHVRSAEL